MPNPNEEYRKYIEQKEEQLMQYQDSRNSISQGDGGTEFNTDRLRWCQELIETNLKIDTGYLAKSDKEQLLRRVRELEKLTGLKARGKYNG